MRAGKTIYFGPGTEIRTGTTYGGLHAYIQKFDCATDNGDFYRTAQTDSSATTFVEDLQPHYVNYPEDEITNTSPPTENLVTELPLTGEQNLQNEMLIAYPNYSKEFFVKPTITTSKVNIYFTLANNEYAFVKLMGMNGAIVFSKDNIDKSNTSLSIDLSEYASGTYILKYNTTNGISKTEKVIKQ